GLSARAARKSPARRGARRGSRCRRRAPATASVESLVERALARLQALEGRHAVALEVLGLAVALVRRLVRVLLVDQEDPRIVEPAAGLVVQASRFGAGR